MKRYSTLLPAVIALLTLAACGSGGTRTVVVTVPPSVSAPTAPPSTGTPSFGGTGAQTTTSNSIVAAPPASRTVHLTTFRSPTGNIGCAILDGTARCDISERSWKPPARPASCAKVGGFGQGLKVGRTGPGRFVCAGDTTLDPSGTPLRYGDGSVEGDVDCVSAFKGMTCRNLVDAHGFFISRQGYKVF
jgi:hypothetical protein